MNSIESRIKKYVDEIVGNEALLEMLETDAAAEMLNWGITTATSLVKKTQGMDDPAAELVLEPQLKAVRQMMRSAGNWAVGKYADPAGRTSLREKLTEYRTVIYGTSVKVLPGTSIDSLLNQVDDKSKTPLQLIQNLRAALEASH